MNHSFYQLGLDIGSTTAKIVLLAPSREVLFTEYRRHNAETLLALQELVEAASKSAGDVRVKLLLTGSAGLGLSERFRLPFIQEIIASTEFIRSLHPQVKTLLDIGGEDAKLIFFDADSNGKSQPDIRMNGACAGGTGAYLDQMATLLNIPIAGLDELAIQSKTLYPIASRCGVFAKTDVQNLLSREASREDIAASIFHALVLQTLATLARGRTFSPVILFAGGPLTFLPELRAAFVRTLNLAGNDWLEIKDAELVPSWGAALAVGSRLDRGTAKSTSKELAAGTPSREMTLSQLSRTLERRSSRSLSQNRLQPLFTGKREFQTWAKARGRSRVAKVDIEQVKGGECFLGIDSGSTTTKLVLVDRQGRLFFDDYRPNNGNPIQAVIDGLEKLRLELSRLDQPPRLVRSTVTGYGEDLIRLAFGCDEGMVETIAHYRAARHFDPQVSFILDIGGQDMKAIFVRQGSIQRIEVNEACSSGCGTFIEAFARSLNRSVVEFAGEACEAQAPCDLGTRCTVFMNSRVKQALREGAMVEDISAGLAYSVIKNALHKVLKLTDTSVLGEHIVVQGGSFRNPAIQRSLEKILDMPVVCPDKAELMGAYGAALTARDAYVKDRQGSGLNVRLDQLASVTDYQRKTVHCQGCENHCEVARLTFPNRNVFYTGNRCERFFNNRGKQVRKGANLYASKLKLLFDRPLAPEGEPKLTLGIPRALNFYENFPFWCTLFVECGIKVHLSSASSGALFEKGAGTVMSENICFPAKLLHGHIFDLCEAGVDRIFYPMVFYEKSEFSDAINTFNCPIVSGYPDVVNSAIDPAGRFGIPFDQPAFTFKEQNLLEKCCVEYLQSLGISRQVIKRGFERALAAQAQYKFEISRTGGEILKQAREDGRNVIILAGHPYHVDPLINHKIPEALAGMGVDVITEDAVPLKPGESLADPLVLTQWEYLNRIFHAARWSGEQPDIEMAQLNSFGCGPDAFAIDEVRGILEEFGKNQTVIRIDEINSLGSARLRLRSMLQAKKENQGSIRNRDARKTTRLYRSADQHKTIIVPEFSRFCTPPIVRPAMDMGYKIETLPSPDQESVQAGLKYTNNEICYPGIIVIGDAIKALQSGKYNPDEVIVGSWETGGQCRASNISCLLKKALVAAHLENTPVVTLSTRLKSFNPQPEFKFNIIQYLYKALLGMLYTDGLSAMYHAAAVREITPGDASRVAEKYLAPFENGSMPLKHGEVLDRLRHAVQEFNRIPIDSIQRPVVGIVGEIYVKYNTFVNNNLVQWLMDQGMEVVLPPLLSFFHGSFVGFKAAIQARIRKKELLWYLTSATQGLVQGLVNQTDSVLKDFHHYHPRHSIHSLARTAQSAVHLTHQYGEGWLLAGEIGEFIKAGVPNILCLQPFGCIANHVVAKGVSRRLKERFEDLNLLFLDLDAGISDVNFVNRLHFFIEQAKGG